MEGTTWLRIAAIVAMVLGSLYVLAPTAIAIVEGPETELPAPTGPATKGPDTEIVFVPADPAQAEAAATALEKRLRLAGVPMQRVRAADGQVEVVVDVGGRRETVEALASAPAGNLQFTAIDAFVGGPEQPVDAGDPLAAPWWPEAVGLAGQPLPPDAIVAGVTPGAATVVGDEVRLEITSEEALPHHFLVAVNGQLRAVASATDAGWRVVPLLPAEAAPKRAEWPADLLASLAGPLPTTLSPAPAEEASVEEAPVAEAAPTESVVPAWLKGMLPDTEMNLGLDLQGGIDLDLEVQLEEAVLAQVARDANYVRSQMAEDGLPVDKVERSHVDPVIRISTAAPLGDITGWMGEKLRTYQYTGTDTPNGGPPVHLFEMKGEEQLRVQEDATEQVLETLRKRVDATGVKEPSIVKKGLGRINVQLPGKVDLDQAIDAIGTTAVLEFRLVDEEFDEAELERMLAAAERELPPDQYADDELLNRWLHDTGRLAEDRLVLWQYEEVEGGDPVRSRAIPLKEDVILTGNDINNAGVSWDQNQQPYVALEFKSRGSQIFCDVTGENVKKRFAIILDDQIRSAPEIRERICGGRASIEMGAALDAVNDANTLALVLRTGSLTAPVNIGKVVEVGSTLGKDSIRSGSMATVIGASLVFVFMALWYRRSGLVANFSLLVNILLVLSALAMFGATLTLPGIAGIALTVGMAVDANIIIYERIREELRLGVNARKAVDAGFEKAFSAIIDGNITTAIAGIVLFSYGTGPIKGFAVTLTIGIVTTLISALFVSRTLMEVLTRSSTARLSI